MTRDQIDAIQRYIRAVVKEDIVDAFGGDSLVEAQERRFAQDRMWELLFESDKPCVSDPPNQKSNRIDNEPLSQNGTANCDKRGNK
jgi:hypothetical protein